MDASEMLRRTRKDIKSWPKDEQPREKLVLKGPGALSNKELVAILLRTGSRNRSVMEVADDLLSSCDHNLNRLGRLSVGDFMNFDGIGEVKAILLAAALELGRRRKAGEISMKAIKKSADAAAYLQPLYADLRHEVFSVLYLSTANKVLRHEKISEGGTKGTTVDPKIVMRKAVLNSANSMILCHNHPSGNLQPSKADIHLTNKLRDAARLLDLTVLDHLIVSSEGFYSFADEGLL